MTKRSFIDNEHEFACWDFQENPRRTPKPRVVVIHQDKSIGESLVRLLALKGYEAIHTEAIAKARIFVSRWKPHAILLDTRLDSVSHYSFTRQLRADETSRELMLLAMSNIWPTDSVPAMRQAGFNAHCRRPCSLWRVVDALDAWFKQAQGKPAAPMSLAFASAFAYQVLFVDGAPLISSRGGTRTR